jgi:hypothetical protein
MTGLSTHQREFAPQDACRPGTDIGGCPLFALNRLDSLVQERLGGDKARLLELFETREVFDLLKSANVSTDWYHFEPKTFDGQYLVATPAGFQVYQQERGAKSDVRDFSTLREAAAALFC